MKLTERVRTLLCGSGSKCKFSGQMFSLANVRCATYIGCNVQHTVFDEIFFVYGWVSQDLSEAPDISIGTRIENNSLYLSCRDPKLISPAHFQEET